MADERLQPLEERIERIRGTTEQRLPEVTQSGEVRALSKGIGIMADGSCGSGTYKDRIVHTPAGWRIAHRTVHPRLVPLGG
jgi:hypothetical protein